MKPGTLVAYAAVGEVTITHKPHAEEARIEFTPVLRKSRVAAADYHPGWADADPYYTLHLLDGTKHQSDDVVEVKE